MSCYAVLVGTTRTTLSSQWTSSGRTTSWTRTRTKHSAKVRAAESRSRNSCTRATVVEKGQQKAEGSEKEESISSSNMSTGSYEGSHSQMLLVDDGVRNAFRPRTDGASCVRERN